MLGIYCPSHRSAVLLTVDRIDRIHRSAGGFVVEWRCWCGQAGRTVRAGAIDPGGLPDAS